MASAQFNWNLFPSTKLEASHMVAPLGCMLTPFQKPAPSTEAEAYACTSCGSYMNSHIRFDRTNRMWHCPYSKKVNFLPPDFSLPSPSTPDSQIPIQIRPSASDTVDYILPDDVSQLKSHKLIVTYVLDTYQHTDALALGEFQHLKERVAASIGKLPAYALVLIVTFNETVEVHAASGGESATFSVPKLFPEGYDVSKAFTDSSLFERFNELLASGAAGGSASFLESPFLCSPSTAQSYVSSLRPKLTNSYRAPRSVGLAFLVATYILTKLCPPGTFGRVMAFISGPATLGPGLVLTSEGHMRSHEDVANFRAPLFAAASKFYRALSYVACGYTFEQAQNAVYSANGKLVDYGISEGAPRHTFDIYTGSLDQVGIYEMRHLADCSGGSIVLCDSFASHRFDMSLDRNTAKIQSQKHLCRLTVVTSEGLKIMKAVLNGTELQSSYQSDKHSSFHDLRISDTVTRYDSSMKKRNFTNQWFLGSLSESDTVALYFEPQTVASSSELDPDQGIKEVFIQFQIRYWDAEKKATVLRVVSIKKPTTLGILAAHKVKLSNGKYKLVNSKSSTIKEVALLQSFDAKAWLALFTRLLISKIDTSLGFESFDEVMAEVDRCLVRLLRHFGGVQVNSGASDNPVQNMETMYAISEQFRDLPSYSYSLRRNPQLIRIFNSSPDETAYNHHLFFKCNSEISCRMIKPAFYRVQENQLVETQLDADITSSGVSCFYVLDCVGHIIVYNHFVNSEDKLQLHNSNNEDLVYGPGTNDRVVKVLRLVNDLITGRPVCPKIVLTQTGHSQARFLMARLNPLEAARAEDAKKNWWEFWKTDEKKITADGTVDQFYNEILDSMRRFRIEDA